MKKSFKNRLIKILLISTIIPVVCFIGIFFYKYYKINIDAEKTIFEEEVKRFDKELSDFTSFYEDLLVTSISFIGDSKYKFDEKNKQAFLENILGNGIDSYYYIYDDNITTSSAENRFMKDKVISFMRYSDQSLLWVSAMDAFEEDYIYFGYGSPNHTSGLLVFQIEKEHVLNKLREQLSEDFSFSVMFSNENVFSNATFESPLEDEIKMFSRNNEFYLGKKQKNSLGLVAFLYKNISGEINFIILKLLMISVGLIVYLISMVFFIKYVSKKIMQPINLLTDLISDAADQQIDIEEANIKSSEFNEVFNLFYEMLSSAYRNMDYINQQSIDIKEKNEIMYELNNQLKVSLERISNSTKALEIYEKRSKALVDNIKDLMWVIDSKGRIIYINNVVEDKLGYKVEDLIGVNLENILKSSFENEEAFQDIFYEDFDSIDLVFEKKNRESEEIYSASTKRIIVKDKLERIQGVCKDITEERYIENQMIQKNEISNTLNEISEILTRPENLETILNHIVVRIERLLDPVICTIRLIDDQRRLELVAGIGECYSLIQEKYIDINKDISGRAIVESKIIIMNEMDQSFHDNYDEVYTILEKSRETIYLPLEYDHKVIGVMSIGLREKISEANFNILKVFTNQASAAIEKARIYEELEMNYLNIIKALASTVEAKDSYTEDHSVRVSKYARMISEEIGLTDEEVSYIDIAGLLHDIGKVGVSDLTLTKEGKLSEEEFMEIKKHPVNGARIVSEMKLHSYIIDGVLLHHKRFDLKGYPDIEIDSLPLPARIIGVADAFDAMTSNRSYQKARSFDEALLELKNCTGTQFCPEVVNAMENIIGKIKLTS